MSNNQQKQQFKTLKTKYVIVFLYHTFSTLILLLSSFLQLFTLIFLPIKFCILSFPHQILFTSTIPFILLSI